jgi:hypothetical protein
MDRWPEAFIGDLESVCDSIATDFSKIEARMDQGVRQEEEYVSLPSHRKLLFATRSHIEALVPSGRRIRRLYKSPNSYNVDRYIYCEVSVKVTELPIRGDGSVAWKAQMVSQCEIVTFPQEGDDRRLEMGLNSTSFMGELRACLGRKK